MSSGKIKYYKSIYEIPVWNWYKMNDESNLSYLLILDDYDSIPEHDINLGDVYFNILSQIPHADTTLQRYWINAKKELILLLSGKHNYSAIWQRLGIYENHLDSLFKDFRLGEMVFSDVKALHQYIIDNSNTKDEKIYNLFAALDINSINAEPINEGSILKELALLSTHFKMYQDRS